MPKVTQEYIDGKRSMIVQAAYNVCLRKPVETVTISDVIAETGMSQGAIYRYYDGLDDILADMLSGLRKDYNIIEPLEAVMNDGSLTFEQTTRKVCDILADTMEKHLMDVQKINFDMGVLAMNEPERAAVIMKGIKGPGNMEYLAGLVFPNMIKSGYQPQCETGDIASFISAAYVGIEKSCILSACYSKMDPKMAVQPRALFNTFATTIILLFGGNANE